MSSNRTSISDNMNTAHRQRPDEPDKQQQHNAQANATNNKQSSKSHNHSSHDECDIIGEIIGKYGKYQFFMTFLLSLFQVPNTFHISSTIYQVSLPAHSIFNLAQTSSTRLYTCMLPPSTSTSTSTHRRASNTQNQIYGLQPHTLHVFSLSHSLIHSSVLTSIDTFERNCRLNIALQNMTTISNENA